MLKITGVINQISESRISLVRKSLLFREEYKRIKYINDYSSPNKALI